jgi:centrosomal protein CEP76
MKEIKLEIKIKESNISEIFQQELVLKIEEQKEKWKSLKQEIMEFMINSQEINRRNNENNNIENSKRRSKRLRDKKENTDNKNNNSNENNKRKRRKLFKEEEIKKKKPKQDIEEKSQELMDTLKEEKIEEILKKEEIEKYNDENITRSQKIEKKDIKRLLNLGFDEYEINIDGFWNEYEIQKNEEDKIVYKNLIKFLEQSGIIRNLTRLLKRMESRSI